MLQMLQTCICNCDCYENVVILWVTKYTGSANANINRTLFSTFIIERNGNFQLKTGENKDTVFLIPIHGPLNLMQGHPRVPLSHVRGP